MDIPASVIGSVQAIKSTSAHYWVAKATAEYGEPAVVDKMTQMEWRDMQASGEGSYCQAAQQAITKYQTLMTAPQMGKVYKEMYNEIRQEQIGLQVDENCFVTEL